MCFDTTFFATRGLKMLYKGGCRCSLCTYSKKELRCFLQVHTGGTDKDRTRVKRPWHVYPVSMAQPLLSVLLFCPSCSFLDRKVSDMLLHLSVPPFPHWRAIKTGTKPGISRQLVPVTADLCQTHFGQIALNFSGEE